MPHTYAHPRPAVTTDIVAVAMAESQLKLLLIRRAASPFKNKWALPGGFVEMDEDLADCAGRELAEETGLSNVHLEQLGAFGAPDRDPRGRVITVAYLGLVRADNAAIRAASDAADAHWFAIDDLPPLAFDHAEILTVARQRLAKSCDPGMVAHHLLPVHFTLTELQQAVEAVRGEEMDKRNFQRRLKAAGWLERTDRRRTGHPHRPARLYRVRGQSIS